MITITILGIDPYLVRQVSKNVTKKLANLYECDADQIDFFAPEGLVVHDGVEQNTWNFIVRVYAPLKVKVLENEASEIIYKYLKDACVNMTIEFYYFSQDNFHQYISPNHPRFMTEENSVTEDEEVFEQEEGEEPYLGDIFEGFDEKVKEQEEKKK